jgi:hypothetical protein
MNLPVIPGAFGFGMNTRAAYGGGVNPDILRVTNLNDSGEGSLRAALDAPQPRVIIFEISGTITLSSTLIVNGPYVTIAGQTAPSPGITLKNYGILFQTHDVLCQHFRIRPGGNTCNNGIEAYETNSPKNIVMDHMSVSWSQSKNAVFTNSAEEMNSCMWRCISSEPLYAAPGTGSCSGGGYGYAYGVLLRNNAKKVSVIQNLFASNSERNPNMTGSAQGYVSNNIIYNWLNLAIHHEDIDNVEPPGLLSSVIGNLFKTGPSTEATSYLIGCRYLKDGSQIYHADNTLDAIGGTHYPFTVINGDGIDPQVSMPPITLSGHTPMGSAGLQDYLLPIVGARPKDRDSVDARIISEVINRTSNGFPPNQDAVGGWPDLAVNSRPLTIPGNAHDVTQLGYTVLEILLHLVAKKLEGAEFPPIPPIPPDPPDPDVPVRVSGTFTANIDEFE